MPDETPVYLFTGFLESGKTKFIQGTLEDKRFNAGERTLLLVCEEGEEDYDPSQFSGPNVYLELIDDQSKLTEDNLAKLQKLHKAERVMVEYNGMWTVQDFYEAMPEGWTVYQELCFADAGTFVSYNANMRSLVVDKLTNCEVITFNRVPVGTDTTELHKIVRAVSRRTDIMYELTDGTTVPDDTEDPLPFDVNAPVIEIEDRDYALFYRDIGENMTQYDGKTVRFKGVVAKDRRLADGSMFVGRHVMTCCVQDIAYNGMICRCADADKYKSYDWVIVEAKISIGRSKFYKGDGPVLTAMSVTPSVKPEEEVATFY